MASVHSSSKQKQSRGWSTSKFIIGRIPAVSMQVDFIIPWLTTRTVICPFYWSCLPAPACCAMLLWSGKRTKAFIRKLPSQSWLRTDLIVWTTSIIRMTVVRTHPAALQGVASCQPRLALQTHMHSSGIPGTHYRRATNRGCIKHCCYSQASDPTCGEPNDCRGDQRGSSACWQCCSSWLFDLWIGASGAWDRKHWAKQHDRQQLHGRRTPFRDPKVQQGLRSWRWQQRRARWQAATEVERSDLGTGDVDGYKGDDGDDADGDEVDEASQANAGSTQNVKDWGHSTRECEDWAVYFRPVKYDNVEANATASDVSEAKSVL